MQDQDRKFYDILLEIKSSIGGMKTELESHKEAHKDIRDMLTNQELRMSGHGRDIQKLKDFEGKVKTKVGTISAIFSGGVALIATFAKDLFHKL